MKIRSTVFGIATGIVVGVAIAGIAIVVGRYAQEKVAETDKA